MVPTRTGKALNSKSLHVAHHMCSEREACNVCGSHATACLKVVVVVVRSDEPESRWRS